MRNYPYIDKLVLAGNVAGYLIACMIVGDFLPLLSAPALTGIILGAVTVVGSAVVFVIIEENKKQEPKGHILNKDLVSQIQDNFKSKNIYELKEILSEQDLSQYSYEAFAAAKNLMQVWESKNKNMDRDKISYLQDKYESTENDINAINRKNSKLSTWKKSITYIVSFLFILSSIEAVNNKNWNDLIVYVIIYYVILISIMKKIQKKLLRNFNEINKLEKVRDNISKELNSVS